jgi:hypothetical protein
MTDSSLPILLPLFVCLHLISPLMDIHKNQIWIYYECSGKETRRAATSLIVKFLNLILIVHLEEMEEYRKEK